MKKIIPIIILILSFLVFQSSVLADSPHETLNGQYEIKSMVTHLTGNSWIFTYTITNLTEGTGAKTGLDGFYVKVPLTATISNVQVPAPYKTGTGAYWEFNLQDRPDFKWASFWGGGPDSVYPVGTSATFSFQVDNVQVGTNTGLVYTYFYDLNMQYPDPSQYELWYKYYDTQLTSPVPILPPGQQIDNIQDYFQDSVIQGDLLGVGPTPKSAEHKLTHMYRMLERSEYLIDNGFIRLACHKLNKIYERTDGSRSPPDYVTGPATESLAAMIDNLMNGLGCR